MKKKILTSLLLVAMLFSVVFTAVACKKKKGEVFNYNTSDLSAYLSVPANFHKTYTVDIDIPEIEDADVEEKILKVLSKNKITPDGPVYSLKDVTISAGDVAALYYRGYTVEDGVKKYFDGGCNFGEGNFDNLEVEIGSGKFVPGFESGLIGKNQKDYASLTRKKDGDIAGLSDVISLTYSVTRADGTVERNKTTVIDLSDPDIDEKWGEGFTLYLTGKKIGVAHKFATGNGNTDKMFIVPTVVAGATGEDIYIDMTVNSACRIGTGEKLVVEARFPKDYSDVNLKGKTGYFEVYIQSVRDYTTPTLDDAFITGLVDTEYLNISVEELSTYEGATLVDKYRAFLKQDLNNARDEKIEVAVEESFWEQIIAATTFKQLPESEVMKDYNNAVAELEELFESGYNTYYNNDLDAFARAYYDLSSTADWQSVLRKNAEDAVKRRLVFYYLVRTDSTLMPDDAKYNEIYEMIFNTYLQEYLDYYEITETNANYAQELEAAKKAVEMMYAEEYWREFVIYEYAIEKLIANATLV